MNKTERIAVAVLFIGLIAWSYFGRYFAPPPQPPAAETSAVEQPTALVAGPEAGNVPLTNQGPTAVTSPRSEASAVVEPVAATDEAPAVRQTPETKIVVSNAVMQVTFTSWGGGIASVTLNEFNATMDHESGPVVFDYTDRTSLSYKGLPGLSEANTFAIEPLPGATGVVITAASDNGLTLVRTAVLDEGYAFTVVDRLSNYGEQPLSIRGVALQAGAMRNLESGPSIKGIDTIGVDILLADAGKVEYLGSKLSGLFGAGGGFGCSSPVTRGMPLYADDEVRGSIGWVAVKSKFFTQIIEPLDGGVTAVKFRASRVAEKTDFDLESVSAGLMLPDLVIDPGQVIERRIRYYAGPKKYTLLKAEGNRRADIMEFGRFFKPVCVVLLPLLNWIEAHIPGGFGIAIILLTIIVKLVFWPVTHKGTESMKRMQALQPEIKKLREKYKSDPKKLQEKQMLLYREHKVNPLAGCLPMLVQIPVFIGLFTVLRSAVELRFSSFLWIRDLSEPEGLLAGSIPYLSSGLNILPLLMTATMVLQQKLTPSVGDPQQQKIMAFMPVMMLFIFYNMPSALVLYWTVSQALSILQLVMQQRKERQKTLAATPA